MTYEELEAMVTAMVADPEALSDSAANLLQAIKPLYETQTSLNEKITSLEGKLSEARFANFQARLGNPPEEEHVPTFDELLADFKARLNKED